MRKRNKNATKPQGKVIPIDDENKIIDGEETDTCWFTVVTILFIIAGIISGTLVKNAYYATIKADPTIPHSELVPFKLKLVNWVMSQGSRFESWETKRKFRNFLAYFSQISSVIFVFRFTITGFYSRS